MIPASLPDLIARQQPGHTLQREFYTDPRIFEADMQRMLLRHWFCVAHLADLPQAGDYLLAELGAESLIIVRNRNEEIRALVNVCRHRGSRICTATSGRAVAGRFTCPYHAWTYDLNGRLIGAHQMPGDFDRASHGLKELPVRIVAGLIFTTFAAQPLDFSGAEQALAQSARIHGWAQAKVAHRRLYSIQANWKLAIENYMECYHCQPAHAEFSRRHVYARPATQVESLEREGRRRAELLGIVIPDVDQYALGAPAGAESVSVFRSALDEGVDSATPDSRPIGRLMGKFPRHDGNSTYIDIGPLSDFLAYADHGVIYRFIPRSVLQTDMEVIWLVHEEAVEGRDYDIERLTWLWHVTSLEDKKIVELNQAGVSSQFFRPGPYSLQEPYPRRFVEWYLHELSYNGNES
jgi:phenylpropionate dioxygenase-like ring-hydroxylating dioxygenase large terminal subunit